MYLCRGAPTGMEVIQHPISPTPIMVMLTCRCVCAGEPWWGWWWSSTLALPPPLQWCWPAYVFVQGSPNRGGGSTEPQTSHPHYGGVDLQICLCRGVPTGVVVIQHPSTLIPCARHPARRRSAPCCSSTQPTLTSWSQRTDTSRCGFHLPNFLLLKSFLFEFCNT